MTKKTVFIWSIIFFSVTSVVVFQSNIGFCENVNGYSRNCLFSNFFEKFIGESFFDLSLSLFIVSVIIFFVRNEVFKKWVRVMRWWFPISIVLLSIIPSRGHGFLPPLISKEEVSLFVGVLFVFSSFIIFIKESKRLQKKK